MNLEKFSSRGSVEDIIARILEINIKARDKAEEQYSWFAPVQKCLPRSNFQNSNVWKKYKNEDANARTEL
jgi:hypothetical protein